jgi:hypothetical protein
MPKFITAQTIPSPSAPKALRAASAFAVLVDLVVRASNSKSGQMR